MERLTKRDESGCLNYPWEFNGVNGSYDILDEDLLAKQIDRLAAYEDTGLDPEDVRRLQGDWTSLIMTLDEMGGMPHLHDLLQAEQDGRLLELPFVAMVEQSLQDGKMKPLGDQKHNGRYAVVYVDRNKWKSPLIDICGKPYLREEAEARMAVLAQEGGESEGKDG